MKQGGSDRELIKFSPPFYTDDEIEAVSRCLKNGWTGSGPTLKEFEGSFAEYLGIKHTAGLGNCTAAIFLSLKALGVGEGCEVITTSMTFCSTVNAIIHCGAKPVLCDIDRHTKNISIDQLERKINSRTRAVIPVHYAGFPCNMTRINEICESKDINVIEDCAHAIESMHAGAHCGTFGTTGCFSFYATKNIAIGEGGMVTSQREDIINHIRILGLHGMSKDAWRRFDTSNKRSYDVVEVGYKMNMTDVQAAIGIAQLKKIDEMRKRRVELWDRYNDALQHANIDLPNLPTGEGDVHALHLYACGLPKNIDRDEFAWRCSEEHGVLLGIHYNSIADLSIYKTLGIAKDPELNLPNSLDWGRRTVSLSLSAGVSDSQSERIIDAVQQTLRAMDA